MPMPPVAKKKVFEFPPPLIFPKPAPKPAYQLNLFSKDHTQ
jgi:hypothetical protein